MRRRALPYAAVGFDDHYRALFGDRWAALEAAMRSPPRFAARANPFAAEAGVSEAGAGADALAALGTTPVPGLAGTFEAARPLPAPARDAAGLLRWYLLDAASILAVEALAVPPGARVLDMCAAPGGKAWQLACPLAESGELVANDRSAARRARLARVLDDYLPPDVRARVRVTGHDATRWSLFERDAYDRVLVDAPCSAEQHVLLDPGALRRWTPARSKQLATRQYALLAAALDAVRVGGRIVYATCALQPRENDGIVARLLADGRRAGRARTLPPPEPFGEPTVHGLAVLPDASNWGPLYLAVIERVA